MKYNCNLRIPGLSFCKVIPSSTPCLFHLLLLAELFVHASSRPTNSPSHCGMFRSMINHMDRLVTLSKKLHGLSDEDLNNLSDMEYRLNSLPHLPHHAGFFRSLKLNKSISQLYVYTESLKLHVDWLKGAQENFSLPSQSAEDASSHLLQLSNLLNVSLHQISEEVPQSPSPSFPVASYAFDVLQFSVEISEHLEVFCIWSKTVLKHLQRLSRCPR